MPTQSLKHFVRDREIVKSSELIRRLTSGGVSETNARQIMKRRAGRDQVWRSDKLELPRRERLFARQQFRESPGFMKPLIQVLDKDRPGLARCLRRLDASKVVLLGDVARLTGSTVTGKSRGIPSLSGEIDALLDTGTCVRQAENTVLDRLAVREIAGTEKSGAMAFDAFGAQTKETILSNLILDSYRKSNLLSWTGCSVASNLTGYTEFNKLAFSATGFSYLQPLLRWRKGQSKPVPCPVLIDVNARRCTLDDVEAFRFRIQRAARGNPSKWRQLGLIAAPDFEKDAWDGAKKAGLIAINLRQMVGDAALDMLSHVEGILKQLPGSGDHIGSGDPDKLATMLLELKTNPFVVELKSIAFEVIVALILRSKGYEQVELGLKVPFNKENRDVDVFGVREDGNEVYIIECKAHAGGELESGVVKRFFTQTIKATLKHKGLSGATTVHAEIWTTGCIGDDAARELEEIQLKDRIKPRLKDFDEVAGSLSGNLTRCKRLLKVIQTTKDTL